MRRWILNPLLRLWSLFVDDFALAASVMGWVLVIAIAVGLDLPSEVAGPLLFAGLAGVLLLSVWRAVRRKR